MRLSNLLVPASLVHLVLARAFPAEKLKGRQLDQEPVCSSAQPTTKAPHKNFWGSLTKKETADVLALLHSNATGFNLTVADKATRYVFNSERKYLEFLTRLQPRQQDVSFSV
jgi:primary-amine oxidase